MTRIGRYSLATVPILGSRQNSLGLPARARTDRPLGVAARRRDPCCELAVHAPRHHADE
jgi:hypothetical protein